MSHFCTAEEIEEKSSHLFKRDRDEKVSVLLENVKMQILFKLSISVKNVTIHVLLQPYNIYLKHISTLSLNLVCAANRAVLMPVHPAYRL